MCILILSICKYVVRWRLCMTITPENDLSMLYTMLWTFSTLIKHSSNKPRPWHPANWAFVYITSAYEIVVNVPESKVHGTNMGSICGRQAPGGTHVDPMNLPIWVYLWHYWVEVTKATFINCSVKDIFDFIKMPLKISISLVDLHIWRASPHLSCGVSCQIWTWYSVGKQNLDHVKIGNITERRNCVIKSETHIAVVM